MTRGTRRGAWTWVNDVVSTTVERNGTRVPAPGTSLTTETHVPLALPGPWVRKKSWADFIAA